jgi:glycosyltransferase involved in cell wall biosynthesis
MVLPSAYKPVFDYVVKMAKGYKLHKSEIVNEYYQSLYSINKHINELLFTRLEKKFIKNKLLDKMQDMDIEKLIENLELPSHLRAYTSKPDKNSNYINLDDFLDGLAFPFFTTLLMLSAHFTSTYVLFNTRPFLKVFSKQLNKYQHPERVLWLTDTFDDKNGVSTVLKIVHQEIKKRNLPIDMLVVSETLESDDHLKVIRPISQFKLPQYNEQPIKIPNFIQLHNLFAEGEYDRIICSTEGVMGLVGLYLKKAFSVKAYFYIHTDWVMFFKKTLNFNKDNLNRVRRILRSFYKAFDKLFVLNNDHIKWLTSKEMNISKENVCLTAHWVDDIFRPTNANKKEVLGIDENVSVMLYVGRVSKEKGVLDLPYIYKNVKKTFKNIVLVIVGNGPATEQLKNDIPDAIFHNWVDRDKLPDIYSVSDVLLFPSIFDTFSCVVLESISCGLPVVAYKAKGPKDILKDEKCGYLVKTKEQMTEKVIYYLQNKEIQQIFKKEAVKRAENYNVDTILNKFLTDIEL